MLTRMRIRHPETFRRPDVRETKGPPGSDPSCAVRPGRPSEAAREARAYLEGVAVARKPSSRGLTGGDITARHQRKLDLPPAPARKTPWWEDLK